MKKSACLIAIMALCLGLILAPLSVSAAGPKDVKAKALEAAKFLAQKGDAALAAINQGGKWKMEPYVFVLDYNGTILAHPWRPQMAGRSMASMKDVKGNPLVETLVASVKTSGHGWSQYFIPKPGEMKPSRKVVYSMKVPDKDWVVSCGAFGFTKEQAVKQAGD